jgi:hypothetical protein
MDAKLDVLRAFFRIGVFLGVCGLLLALVEPRHSPEFILSLCSAGIGGALMLGVAITVRLSGREPKE